MIYRSHCRVCKLSALKVSDLINFQRSYGVAVSTDSPPLNNIALHCDVRSTSAPLAERLTEDKPLAKLGVIQFK